MIREGVDTFRMVLSNELDSIRSMDSEMTAIKQTRWVQCFPLQEWLPRQILRYREAYELVALRSLLDIVIFSTFTLQYYMHSILLFGTRSTIAERRERGAPLFASFAWSTAHDIHELYEQNRS